MITEKILNDYWKNFFYNVFESPIISNLISTVYKYGANFKDKLKKKLIQYNFLILILFFLVKLFLFIMFIFQD